ncbi:hypothetical protein ACFC1B_07155 [Streptomyces xiamenensis]|uniref:hypothetical protein n=1 Tax=Streptomyces xiamenensis TaxID=408015 RepID=UPI0035D6789E
MSEELTPAERRAREKRQANIAAFYNGRQKTAGSQQEVASVMADYARAVATQKSGGDPHSPVWADLAETLHTWSRSHNQ